MIRYVLAIILTVALLGAGYAGLDIAATANSERTIQASVAELEDAAVSLATNDELPPAGHPGPRRIVDFELPDRSLTSEPLKQLEVRRVEDERLSVVEFRVEGGPAHTETINAPITNGTGGDVVTFRGTADRDLHLTLVADEDRRALVKVVRRSEIDTD